MQLLSLVCGFEVLLLTLVQLSTFFSSLLGESFCVCVLSQQSQCSLAGSMPTLRGIVRLRFKNEPQGEQGYLAVRCSSCL